ncbi:MAG: rhomboid family intramembrane serine protease, partial [Hyphomicrobiaceae bacterium]
LDFARFPMTYAIIVLNVLISGYAFFVDSELINRWSLQIGSILKGRQYYRVLTSGFLHADPTHFLFNMVTLFFFGRFMEAMLGPIGFLTLYFGSELAANGLSIWSRRNDLYYASIGASGAVSGVLVGFCLLRPFDQIYIFFLPFGIPAFLYAGLYIAYSMYAMDNSRGGGIAHEAHLGGALGGILLTCVMIPQALQIFFSHFT